MAKLTLLSMVQNILSSLDSDNVNTIDATPESSQVAEVIRETYFEILDRRNWEFMSVTGQLESVGDTDKPTKIKIPETFHRIGCLKYKVNDPSDATAKWKELTYLYPYEFINKVQGYDTSESNVTVYTNDSNVELYCKNDTDPSYYTSFDDQYIYFDNYDSSKDTTVQQSKTSVIAVKTKTFTLSDTFVPDLPDEMFSLLLSESKSTCHLLFKQQPNYKAEQVARRQYILMREQEPTIKPPREYYDYGKKTGKGRSYNSQWKGTPTSSGYRI
jgi:hypothetical protein